MKPDFHDHFSGVSDRYADFRPRYPEALLDYLATLAPRASRVWDCAAGNGQATVDLARRFDRVIATDASREQISAAPPLPNVEYRVATAESSGLPDASVSLITVAQALHWFDLDRFYAEVRRVLVPGGVLAVWAYGIKVVEGEEVNALIQRFYSTTVGPYWPPQRTLVEEGYRTLPFPFVESMPPTLTMEAEWTLDQLLGYLGTWSATTRCTQAQGHSPLPALAAELAPLWGDPGRRRHVTWPLTLRVGRLAPPRDPAPAPSALDTSSPATSPPAPKTIGPGGRSGELGFGPAFTIFSSLGGGLTLMTCGAFMAQVWLCVLGLILASVGVGLYGWDHGREG